MSSIEKNEKRETIAEIVAEIRRDIKLGNNYYAANLPDRIEAAWKRDEERAIEHATHHAESVARDNCRDCIHNPNGKNYEPIGNAAATYAALVKIHDLTNALDEECGVDPVEIRDIARTALSAPARNCDRFVYKDPVIARNHAVEHWQHETDCSEDFAIWLLATAAERKGEGDGR